MVEDPPLDNGAKGETRQGTGDDAQEVEPAGTVLEGDDADRESTTEQTVDSTNEPDATSAPSSNEPEEVPQNGGLEPGEEDDEAEEDSSEPAWQSEVRPFLVKLAKHLRDRDSADHSVSVPIGNARILVTPYEQKLVIDSDELGDDEFEPPEVLIRDSLGLQVKTYADLRSYAKAVGAARTELFDTLNLDVELGRQLAYEMHRFVSSLSTSGELDAAKQFTGFRRGLRLAVDEAADVVDAGHREAEEEGAVADPTELSPSEAEWEKARKIAAARRAWEDSRRIRLEKRQRTRRNILILAVVLALLAGAVVRLWMYLPKNLVSFTETSFDNIPGVEQVISRPPDLILVVSYDDWSGVNEDERLRRLGLVVDKIQLEGYRRVEFRAKGGRSGLAVWNKGGSMEVSN